MAKGIRRINAITGEYALEVKNLASLLEKEVNEASTAEGSALDEKFKSLKRRYDEAVIPAAGKARIKKKLTLFQVYVYLFIFVFTLL